MKISVIIPCRNEKGQIREFLDSVLAQEFEPGWEMEVLVADGMSDDGTREVLRSYAARASNVHMIGNPGRIVSTGLNAAIEASTGDIVIRLDAHTTYAKDYIRECVNALEKSGADNVGGPWVARGRGRTGRAIAAAFQSRFCAGGGRAHDPNYEGEVDTVYLGCWPRAVFRKTGLFDPDLVRNQDDEFNFRLKRLGGRIWQSPRIKSCYTPRDSIAALFRQYMQYGFWKMAVIRKHRALAAWRHAVPPLFVGSILIGAVLVALAAMLGMSSVATWIGAALAGELLIYALACTAAAMAFVRSLDLPALLILPLIMAVYHIAYGSGFLLGVLRPVRRRTEGAPPARLFTELTR